jgi:hypothetical protein
MNRRDVPAAVLSKLIELYDAAKYLSDKVIELEQAIASARARLTGGFKNETEYDECGNR